MKIMFIIIAALACGACVVVYKPQAPIQQHTQIADTIHQETGEGAKVADTLLRAAGIDATGAKVGSENSVKVGSENEVKAMAK